MVAAPSSAATLLIDTAAKPSVKVDLAVQERVQAALAAANLVPDVVSLDNGSLKVRFDNTDKQIKAKDAIQLALVPDQPGDHAIASSYLTALKHVHPFLNWR